MKKGDQYFALGEYYDAAAEYKAAYSKTKTRERGKRGERALKMADCYRRINYTAKAVGAYQNGIRYLEKSKSDRQKIRDAVEATRGDRPVMETPFMDIQDSLDEAAILDATLKLARQLHKSGDYKNAIKNYEQFIAMSKGLYASYPTICTPKNDTLAMNGIIGARQALLMKQRPRSAASRMTSSPRQRKTVSPTAICQKSPASAKKPSAISARRLASPRNGKVYTYPERRILPTIIPPTTC